MPGSSEKVVLSDSTLRRSPATAHGRRRCRGRVAPISRLPTRRLPRGLHRAERVRGVVRRMKKIALVIALLADGAANAGTIEMKVFGMVCVFCAQGIESNLRKNSAVSDVQVSLEKQLVVVKT